MVSETALNMVTSVSQGGQKLTEGSTDLLA